MFCSVLFQSQTSSERFPPYPLACLSVTWHLDISIISLRKREKVRLVGTLKACGYRIVHDGISSHCSFPLAFLHHRHITTLLVAFSYRGMKPSMGSMRLEGKG